MESFLKSPESEKGITDRREIAQEIISAISGSLQNLYALHEGVKTHSNIVELEEELRIAQRAQGVLDAQIAEPHVERVLY